MTQLSNPELLEELLHVFSELAKKNANDIKAIDSGKDLQGHSLDKNFLRAKMITLQSSTETAIKAFEEISLLIQVCRGLNKINCELTESLRSLQEKQEIKDIQAHQVLENLVLAAGELKKIKQDNEKIKIIVAKQLQNNQYAQENLGLINPALFSQKLRIRNQGSIFIEENNCKNAVDPCLTTTQGSPAPSEKFYTETDQEISQPSSPLLQIQEKHHKMRRQIKTSFLNSMGDLMKQVHNFFAFQVVTKRIRNI